MSAIETKARGKFLQLYWGEYPDKAIIKTHKKDIHHYQRVLEKQQIEEAFNDFQSDKEYEADCESESALRFEEKDAEYETELTIHNSPDYYGVNNLPEGVSYQRA